MHNTSNEEAKSIFEKGMEKIRSAPEPLGQKFPIGTRVHITKELGDMMSHFESDCDATVLHTYAHAYWGDDVESYALDVDGVGHVAWYYEWQLEEIK